MRRIPPVASAVPSGVLNTPAGGGGSGSECSGINSGCWGGNAAGMVVVGGMFVWMMEIVRAACQVAAARRAGGRRGRVGGTKYLDGPPPKRRARSVGFVFAAAWGVCAASVASCRCSALARAGCWGARSRAWHHRATAKVGGVRARTAGCLCWHPAAQNHGGDRRAALSKELASSAAKQTPWASVAGAELYTSTQPPGSPVWFVST